MSYTVAGSKKRYVGINAQMPPDDHQSLKALAAAQGRSVSWLSGRVLSNYVKQCRESMEVPTEVPAGA